MKINRKYIYLILSVIILVLFFLFKKDENQGMKLIEGTWTVKEYLLVGDSLKLSQKRDLNPVHDAGISLTFVIDNSKYLLKNFEGPIVQGDFMISNKEGKRLIELMNSSDKNYNGIYSLDIESSMEFEKLDFQSLKLGNDSNQIYCTREIIQIP